MSRADTSQRFLVAGLIVSLVGHCAVWGIASGFVRVPKNRGVESKAVDAKKPVPEPKVAKPKLGIDDGRLTSLAWLGYQEATPHAGLQATTDQSAMTPSPGAPTPAAPVPTPAQLQPTPPVPPVTSAQLREAAQALSGMSARISDAVKTMANAVPVPPKPPAPDVKAASGGGGASGETGLKSDKESIATSIASAPTVQLGKVAAAYGLDIQTKSPKWSLTTLQTRRPSNPTIRITFGRDGKVVRADFVSDELFTYNTGSTDVDEPLISAVYSWVARGKRLEELTSRDPNGEVTIIIRVLLAG